MKKLFFFLILLGSFPQLVAQKYSAKEIDSLIQVATHLLSSDKDKSLQLSKKTYQFSKQIGYSEGKVKSWENIAQYYYYDGNSDHLITYAVLAEKEALKIENYSSLCNALRMKAVAYSRLGLHEQADKEIAKAKKYVNEISDPDDFHIAKKNIYYAQSALVGYKEIPIDSVFIYNKRGFDEFLLIKDKIKVNPAKEYLSIASAYMSTMKHNDTAIYYCKKALELSLKYKDYITEYRALAFLGNIYQNKGNYPSAIDFYLKALDKMKVHNYNELEYKAVLYSNLQGCYSRVNNKEGEREYSEKSRKLQDSINIANKKSLKIPLKQIVKDEEERFNESTYRLYFVISICILALIICLYFVIRYFKNYQKEKQEKFFQETTILENESKLYQLESKINDGFDEVLELAKNDDPAFLARFKEVYPEFYNKLILAYPDLTVSQLRFCAMLRLNFSTKEIAHYHHMTIKGVQVKKNRLRKQLNISSEEDINLWMMDF